LTRESRIKLQEQRYNGAGLAGEYYKKQKPYEGPGKHFHHEGNHVYYKEGEVVTKKEYMESIVKNKNRSPAKESQKDAEAKWEKKEENDLDWRLGDKPRSFRDRSLPEKTKRGSDNIQGSKVKKKNLYPEFRNMWGNGKATRKEMSKKGADKKKSNRRQPWENPNKLNVRNLTNKNKNDRNRKSGTRKDTWNSRKSPKPYRGTKNARNNRRQQNKFAKSILKQRYIILLLEVHHAT
jgi:hypothetical protein